MNFYPFHLGDYVKDTLHLSLLEDAIYRRLLDCYYAHERPLPKDKEVCCRIVRARKKGEKKVVEQILSEFFFLSDDGYRQKRCDAELAKYKDRSNKARQSVLARWSKEKAIENQKKFAKEIWWLTEEGIKQKGNELGLSPFPGEGWTGFQLRIREKLAKSKNTDSTIEGK